MMITPEPATDIRKFLIKEVNNNGFGDIVTEVTTRLEEEYEEEKFERKPHYLLDFFLSESIEVLESLSNKNLRELLNQINKFTKEENRIETINVELLNSGDKVCYNLSELLSYDNIISTFRGILINIRKEN